MKILLIDDVKRPEDFGFDKRAMTIARTVDEGISMLRKFIWYAVYLDHDFGVGSTKTGYDVLDWLSNNAACIPEKIYCISNHSDHAKKMNQMCTALMAMRKRYEPS